LNFSYALYDAKEIVTRQIAPFIDLNKSKSNVLIAHSYGCVLLSHLVKLLVKQVNIESVIFMAPALPKVNPWIKKMIPYFPEVFMDVLRWFDRLGGPNSASVKRFLHTGVDATDETSSEHVLVRKYSTTSTPSQSEIARLAANNDLLSLDALKNQQLIWNKRMSARILKRVVSGAIPFNEKVFSVKGPKYLIIHGENDKLTASKKIKDFVSHHHADCVLNNVDQNLDLKILNHCGHQIMIEQVELLNDLLIQ
jgi:pimeloyl-ACP methyl ester carboxylesterase